MTEKAAVPLFGEARRNEPGIPKEPSKTPKSEKNGVFFAEKTFFDLTTAVSVLDLIRCMYFVLFSWDMKQ